MDPKLFPDIEQPNTMFIELAKSTSDQIYEQIKVRILYGESKPSERLAQGLSSGLQEVWDSTDKKSRLSNLHFQSLFNQG